MTNQANDPIYSKLSFKTHQFTDNLLSTCHLLYNFKLCYISVLTANMIILKRKWDLQLKHPTDIGNNKSWTPTWKSAAQQTIGYATAVPSSWERYDYQMAFTSTSVSVLVNTESILRRGVVWLLSVLKWVKSTSEITKCTINKSCVLTWMLANRCSFSTDGSW